MNKSLAESSKVLQNSTAHQHGRAAYRFYVLRSFVIVWISQLLLEPGLDQRHPV